MRGKIRKDVESLTKVQVSNIIKRMEEKSINNLIAKKPTPRYPLLESRNLHEHQKLDRGGTISELECVRKRSQP